MLDCTSHSMFACLQIFKWNVDQLKKMPSPPCCRLTIMWTGKPTNAFPLVSRKVNLKGTKNPFDYFIIKLPGRGKIVGCEMFEFSSASLSKEISLSGNHVHVCCLCKMMCLIRAKHAKLFGSYAMN